MMPTDSAKAEMEPMIERDRIAAPKSREDVVREVIMSELMADEQFASELTAEQIHVLAELFECLLAAGREATHRSMGINSPSTAKLAKAG